MIIATPARFGLTTDATGATANTPFFKLANSAWDPTVTPVPTYYANPEEILSPVGSAVVPPRAFYNDVWLNYSCAIDTGNQNFIKNDRTSHRVLFNKVLKLGPATNLSGNTEMEDSDGNSRFTYINVLYKFRKSRKYQFDDAQALPAGSCRFANPGTWNYYLMFIGVGHNAIAPLVQADSIPNTVALGKLKLFYTVTWTDV